ncbi:unnamed protein product [Somion occarium]|uniref:Protein CPL1-like domain-containing protein n=1 Tax=Somion occarium TaxID=3059160 RepID=A0ABP1CKL7_9APHY
MRLLLYSALSLVVLCLLGGASALPNNRHAKAPRPSKPYPSKAFPSKTYGHRFPGPSKVHGPHFPTPSKVYTKRWSKPTGFYGAHAARPSKAFHTPYAKPSKTHDGGAKPSKTHDGKARPSKTHGAPRPSPSKRESRTTSDSYTLVKRDQLRLVDEDISDELCPFSLTVCPLTSHSRPTSLTGWIQEGFECVDTESDLNSCGGCGTVNQTHDCTTIPGAVGVSCMTGSCRVDSCQPGYNRTSNGKTCVRSQ